MIFSVLRGAGGSKLPRPHPHVGYEVYCTGWRTYLFGILIVNIFLDFTFFCMKSRPHVPQTFEFYSTKFHNHQSTTKKVLNFNVPTIIFGNIVILARSPIV